MKGLLTKPCWVGCELRQAGARSRFNAAIQGPVTVVHILLTADFEMQLEIGFQRFTTIILVLVFLVAQ